MSTEIETLVHRYVELWNERDAARRDAAMAETVTEDVVYSDPDHAAATGRAGLSEAIDIARGKLGDLRFEPGEVIGAHHGHVLFTWRLRDPGGREVGSGYDVADVVDGRLGRVVGFF